MPEAAKSLGIATNMLYRWKDHIESQIEGKSLSLDEREELKQFRKEVKNLRMEKEILKNCLLLDQSLLIRNTTLVYNYE